MVHSGPEKMSKTDLDRAIQPVGPSLWVYWKFTMFSAVNVLYLSTYLGTYR